MEALIGVLILTASIGTLALVTARQWSRSADVDVLDRVENAVASDLGWLKTYAKYWRLASGPYDLTCTQAGFASGCDVRVFSSSTTDYQPDEARCGTATGLAQDFINAAAAARTTIAPNGPFAIPTFLTDGTTAQTIKGVPPIVNNEGLPLPVPNLPPGTSLFRTIRISATASEKNMIYLTYSFEGAAAAPYRFVREAAIQPEAAAWCP